MAGEFKRGKDLTSADILVAAEYLRVVEARDAKKFWQLLRDKYRDHSFDAVNATLDQNSFKWVAETLKSGPPKG